jgi:hypothetical protein
MKKIAVFVALFLILGSVPGWSICGPVDTWIDEQAASENYAAKAGGMLLRGMHRIIESPVELACHTYNGATDELEYGVGILKGLGYGTLWMIDSILRGGWDILTFAFPDYHGEAGTHVQECWGEHAGGGEA